MTIRSNGSSNIIGATHAQSSALPSRVRSRAGVETATTTNVSAAQTSVTGVTWFGGDGSVRRTCAACSP